MGIMFVSVKEMRENFWVALSREKNSIQPRRPIKSPGWWDLKKTQKAKLSYQGDWLLKQNNL